MIQLMGKWFKHREEKKHLGNQCGKMQVTLSGGGAWRAPVVYGWVRLEAGSKHGNENKRSRILKTKQDLVI